MRLLLLIVAGVVAYFLWRIAKVKLKSGADLTDVSWRMFWAAIVADEVFTKYGAAEAVITSGADGTHSARSKHYAKNTESGLVEALDFRTHNVRGQETQVATALRRKLGNSYDVVLESDHIHIEYDPKSA